jgi:hypothetical protein
VHDECVISYIQKFKVYGGIEWAKQKTSIKNYKLAG